MGLRSYIKEFQAKNQQEDLPEFEAQRRRLQQQLQEQQQIETEGIQRSLARAGGGPAGAGIKLQQQAGEKYAKLGEQGLEGIAGQELAMRRQLAEAEKQRQFATSERVAGQEFASKESGLGREFQKQLLGEQQKFSTAERLGGEAFQREQAQRDLEFRNKVFQFDQTSKLRELDNQDRAFKLESDIQKFNTEMALLEAGKPTDLLGSLFGPEFSTSGNSSLSKLGKGPLSVLGGGIVSPAGSLGGGVMKVFCFVENTLIDLEDNMKIRIQDIQLGDEIKEGGEVYFKGSCFSDDIYSYNGVLVTGSHAVFEEGQFIRVKDSKLAQEVKFLEPQIVHFISTENHLIVSNDILFADYHETDEDLDDDESLKQLNDKLNIEG